MKKTTLGINWVSPFARRTWALGGLELPPDASKCTYVSRSLTEAPLSSSLLVQIMAIGSKGEEIVLSSKVALAEGTTRGVSPRFPRARAAECLGFELSCLSKLLYLKYIRIRTVHALLRRLTSSLYLLHTHDGEKIC